ncbi:hypothetical protein ABPG72_005282 [Tetrahymena utriculariae]
MNGEGLLNFVSDFQSLEQKERLDLNFESLLDDQEKADAELNNSVFTFAQQHNSMIDDQLQLAQNINQQPSNQNSTFPSRVLLETNQNFQTYETCNNCKRQFFQGRLNLHQKSCKPQNPLKPLYMFKINNILHNSNEQNGLSSNQGKKKKIGYREILSSRLSATPTTAGSVEQQKSVNNQIDMKFMQSDEQVSTNLAQLPKWKMEHQSLLLSIKPTQMNSSDFIYQQYIMCQYCLRKFKPQVAEQHIPNCKNIFNRPKPPKKQQEKENEGKKHNERSLNKLKIRKESTEKEVEIKNLSSCQNSQRVSTKDKFFQINDSFDKSITQIKEIEIFQINPQSLNKKLFEKSQKITSIATKKSFKHIDRKLSYFDSSIRGSYDFDKNNIQNQSLKALNKVENVELHKNKSVFNQIYDVSLFGCDHLEQNDYQNKELSQPSSATQLPSIQDKRISNKSSQLQEIRENQGGLSYENVINRSKKYSQVACPYCERIFSKNAAPRHIPICKNILNKPARPLKKSSSSQLQTLIKQNSSYGKIFQTNYDLKKEKNKLAIQEQQQSPLMVQNQQINCFCTQCGSQLFYSFKYCSSCGKKRS